MKRKESVNIGLKITYIVTMTISIVLALLSSTESILLKGILLQNSIMLSFLSLFLLHQSLKNSQNNTVTNYEVRDGQLWISSEETYPRYIYEINMKIKALNRYEGISNGILMSLMLVAIIVTQLPIAFKIHWLFLIVLLVLFYINTGRILYLLIKNRRSINSIKIVRKN